MKKWFIIFFVCVFLIISCKDRKQYNGYIDADLIYLSSDFPGRLEHLLVKRGQPVTKNQLLFTLEKTSERIGADDSRFNRKNLAAQKKVLLDQINYYEINYKRALKMRQQNAASQNDVDLAKEQLDIARNQLEGIGFQIEALRTKTANWLWQMSRKEHHATQDGIIFDTYFTPAEFVAAGLPVLSLLTEAYIKIVFFVPEKALASLRLGQKIFASTDEKTSLVTGEISYISNEAQYTPPMIYSRDEREKLVFRIEARLMHPDLKAVHLGQPVSIELTT